MVEVGGSTGPAFEAQSIDVSREGMHLRTAYLPEVGQPLTCRFDAGPREMVLASGEVVWSREAARGGEFGIRFSNLDADSARILGRMACAAHDPSAPPDAPGMKVRLHIDGLGSPMRARVKGASHAELTVGSELGFLQVGKDIELENAETGSKRHARIDRVEVRVDGQSQVPELLVALRYPDEMMVAHEEAPLTSVVRPEPSDRMAHAHERNAGAYERNAGAYERNTGAHERGAEGHEGDVDARDRAMDAHERNVDATADTIPAEPPYMTRSGAPPSSGPDVDVEVSHDERDSSDPSAHASAAPADRVKNAFSRSAAKVAPAIAAFTSRAKTTFALLAARRREQSAKNGPNDDVATPMRRVTAPPPGGGLHAEGRKVVRDFSALRDGLGEKAPAFVVDKKKMIAGGAVGALLIIGAVAMRKPNAPPPVAENAASEAPIASAAAPEGSAAAPGAAPAASAANGALAAVTPPAPAPANEVRPSDSGFTETVVSRPEHHAPKRVQVAPFTNGSVSHGNVLRLKMDDTIEKIQGAAQSSGFTVVLPSRRSLEAAAPLAARDGRIASIKVVNDPAGAELSVTFKDGVPNYAVRAKGSVLEIMLAPAGRMPERPTLADAHHDGHEGRGHAAPTANAKRKHAAPRHH
ncbi:PilZ domain-containing protein [Pendulispora albinea]|uniref:PilZ domain-containing protein n=1 Tax=Pendulispora albinea TaxID=2741071 RepID=A0ABZ2LV49_9BACT